MNDWVVESPSFIEDLMNNKMVMLNQNGINKVVEIIKEKDKKIKRLNSIIKEAREKINNFDVFKEFTFPLMKRDVENQVKCSINYEWRKSIKEPILKILDKVRK